VSTTYDADGVCGVCEQSKHNSRGQQLRLFVKNRSGTIMLAYIVPLRTGKGVVAAEDRFEDGYVILSIERRVGTKQAVHHHPGRP